MEQRTRPLMMSNFIHVTIIVHTLGMLHAIHDVHPDLTMTCATSTEHRHVHVTHA